MKPSNVKKKDSDKIWIYGQHACFSALANEQRKIYKIFTIEKYHAEILQAVSKREEFFDIKKINIADKITIEKFLPPDSIHQGIVIQADYLERENINIFTANIANKHKSCVLILDKVTDTRNIGSIIRSAVAFEVDAIIFTKANFPKETGAMLKAAAGGVEKIKLIEVSNLVNAIDHLKKEGFWIIGLDAHTNNYLHNIDTFPKTALVLGSEGEGMRELTKKSCDFLVKIPQSLNMESLNISNASAIALYEIYKKSL